MMIGGRSSFQLLRTGPHYRASRCFADTCPHVTTRRRLLRARWLLHAALAAAGLAAAGARTAAAQASSDPGVGLGGHVAFSKARDAESGFFGGGVQMRARLTGAIGVEALLSYRREEYAVGGERVLRVQEIPLQGSVQLFFFSRTPVQPYVLAGGGYYYVRTAGLGSSTAGGGTENRFGFHAGVGVDVRVAPRASVFADVRYTLVDVGAVRDLPGGRKSDFVHAAA